MNPVTLALLGGGSLVNLAGSLANRPQRQTLDIEGILARMGDRENRYVNSTLGRQASVTGQNLAAQGITGPAASQVIGQIEAPLRSASLGRMQDREADLREKQAFLNAQYKSDKGNWWNSLLGDVGNSAGAIAGNINQNKTLDKLGEMDRFHLDRLNQIFNADMRPITQIQASGQTPRVSGMNAQSGMDFEMFKNLLNGWMGNIWNQ